jgi:hypothetical protein
MGVRLVCIRNTTDHQITVKQESFDIILPPTGQVSDVVVNNFNELKESGAYIKVDLREVDKLKESRKTLLID